MNAQTKLILTGEKELQRLDPQLGVLIAAQTPLVKEPRTDYFAALARAIVGQQISVAAANSIAERLTRITALDPHKVVQLSEDHIKEIGLSRPKARYIQDLAAHFVQDSAVYNHLDGLRDDDIIAELTKVKGIGVWTAQMFLMFTLGRLDVFAPDDVGLQRAMMRLYGWKVLPPRSELMVWSERWEPYRTIACWHLWASLDNAPQ